MNRKLGLLAIICALLTLSGIAAAQNSCIKTPYGKKMQVPGPDNNIIENMDFEWGNYGWEFLPDNSKASIVKKAEDTMDHAARIIGADSTGGNTLISQTVPNLTVGNTYTMSAYLKSNHTVNNNLPVILRLTIIDGLGNAVVIPASFYPTDVWQQYSFNFTVPNQSNVQTTKVQVLLNQGPQDTVYVDNISIQNPNLVANADFESGLGDWMQIPDASRVLLSDNGCNGSATCMKLISRENMDGDALLSEVIPNLSLGNTYTVRAYMRSEHPESFHTAEASFQVRLNYINGWSVFIDTLIRPDTQWRLYSYTFTVPDTLQILVSQMQLYYYRGNNDSLYVDNLELLNNGTMYPFVNSSYPHAPPGVFEEDFTGTPGQPLSFNNWLVVKKTWGQNNNGVVPENIELLDTGGIRFHGHGDLYDGPVNGATNFLGNGKIHVGSCIATKNYYASGRYEVVAKLTPGMINAFWTFHYIEDANYQSGGIKNTEIDFEFPGAPTDTLINPGYTGHKAYIDDMNLNTWGGLCNGEGNEITLRYQTNPVILSNGFHKYTIEWHTGGPGIAPSVTWYVDDTFARQVTDTSRVGFRAARFWLGVWYSKDEWVNGGDTAIMNYEDQFMEVRSVKITPFYEANDVYENETDPSTGYVTPQYSGYPVFPSSTSMRPSSSNASRTLASIGAVKADVSVTRSAGNQALWISLVNGKDDYITDIRVLNVNGQRIGRYSATSPEPTIKINLPSGQYAAGIYLLQCLTHNGQIIYKKVGMTK